MPSSSGFQNNLKLAVLRRPGGSWSEDDIEDIKQKLSARYRRHPLHPEFLILPEPFDARAILGVLRNQKPFEHKFVIGCKSPELPFSISL